MEPLFLIIVCVVFWLAWRVLRFITNDATLGDALNAVGIRVFPMTDDQRQRILDLLGKIGENDPENATFEGKKLDELDRDEADQLIKYLKDRLYGGGARVLTFRGRKKGDA